MQSSEIVNQLFVDSLLNSLLICFQASFVVCRVFAKPRGRNSISEHAFSSCAEESIATVRHIGIQHDGITISALDEGKTLNCDYINGKIAGQPSKPIEDTAPNNLVISCFLECDFLLFL